ncbi:MULTISPECIES: hypothetical protein [Burkholderia]|uniref:hypothetical protein n=1 Tax=Burkholderia TaxID=32008 RepID=UPI000F5F3AE3|nr:hypothetical protein [Burkholderia cepacia]RQZ93326.1 hypothetical protein DF055_35460 [Burkholderia cepacia]RQZ97837.1 hypothetical protein DF054_36110 [Burkholderia cepacia]
MAIIVKRGITEEYWGLMSEDRKLGWELFTKGLAIVVALFVTKTGVTIIDWSIGAFAGFTPLIIIRSQRSFRKYSKDLRKRLLCAVVFLGSTGTAVLGLLYFGLAFLNGILQTYASEVAPLRHHSDPIFSGIALGVLLIVAPVVGVKIWRDLKLSELIFHLPKRALKRLVLQRKYVADNFIAFAHFELGVQGVGFLYASVCAEIVKVYLGLFLSR